MKRREDTSQSATTRHAKGMTTGPLQIQPETRREGPAGLTGPESTRRQPRGEGRGGRPGKSGPNRKHPSPQNRQERRQQQHQNQRPTAKKGGALQHQGGKPPEKHAGNGQPQQGHPRQARDARPKCADPNTPHKIMQKRIREDEHTCTVCGQTHPRSMHKLEATVDESSSKTIMRLFTCGQAHNEACKCTADQYLSVAKVRTNLGEGG